MTGTFRPGQIGPTSTRATLDLGMEIHPDFFVAKPNAETSFLQRPASGQSA